MKVIIQYIMRGTNFIMRGKIDKITKEMVLEQYITNNKSRADAAKYFDISLTSFKTLLKKYNIHKPNDLVQQQIVNDCILKYGVPNYNQTQECNEKKRNTFIKNYGVDNPSKCKEVNEKRKETCLRVYGETNPNKCRDVRIKIETTNEAKYGNKCCLGNKEIRNKALNTMKERYGTIYPIQTEECKNKRKETCQELYGCEYSTQAEEVKQKIKESFDGKYGTDRKEIFERIRETNLKLYGSRYYTASQTFKDICEERRKLAYQDYVDIYQFNYHRAISDSVDVFIEITKDLSISEISKLYNCCDATVYNYIHKNDLEYIFINNGTSSYENEVAIYLQNKFPNIIIEKHVRNLLANKEIDLYLPEYKIGIEINGNYWHSEKFKDRYYHQNKSLAAYENEIFIAHIFEYEWLDETEYIKDYLVKLINKEELTALKYISISNNLLEADFCKIPNYLLEANYDFLELTEPAPFYCEYKTRVYEIQEGKIYNKIYDCGKTLWKIKSSSTNIL